MRAILLALFLSACGLEAAPLPDPVERVFTVCLDNREARVFVTRSGEQQPPVFTGKTCDPSAGVFG